MSEKEGPFDELSDREMDDFLIACGAMGYDEVENARDLAVSLAGRCLRYEEALEEIWDRSYYSEGDPGGQLDAIATVSGDALGSARAELDV